MSEKETQYEVRPVATDALLNCPFCGGEAFVLRTRYALTNLTDYVVKCSVCEAQRLSTHTQTEAITEWNTRSRVRELSE